jgi:hypothetical protein
MIENMYKNTGMKKPETNEKQAETELFRFPLKV